MPRIGQPSPRDPEVAAALAALAEFEKPAAWHLSARGNLTREWAGQRVTIFRRGGRWCYVYSTDEDEPVFSSHRYETRADAMAAVADALDIGII